MLTLHYDVANLCSINFYAAAGKTDSPVELGATVLYTTVRDILKLGEMFNTPRAVFHFDGIGSLRKKYDPMYKVKRHNADIKDPKAVAMKAELKAQVRVLKGDLADMGFNNLHEADGYEADDLMCVAARNMPGDHIIISNDEDMLQCINANICVYNKKTKTLWDVATMLHDKGIAPERWHLVKAVGGCKSDEVPGVLGVAEITAVKYLNGVLPAEHKGYKNIKASGDHIKHNKVLVTLPYPGTPVTEWRADTINKDGFMKALERHGLGNYAAALLPKWQQLFVGGGSAESLMAAAARRRRGGW